MELILKTYGMGRKFGSISIDCDGISFGGKTLPTDEMQTISSRLKLAREVLYTTLNGQIARNTLSDSMTLKFRGSGPLINEVLASFVSIRTTIIQHAGPAILNHMLQRMSNGGDVHIGKFVFNRKGITTQTVLRGELRSSTVPPAAR